MENTQPKWVCELWNVNFPPKSSHRTFLLITSWVQSSGEILNRLELRQSLNQYPRQWYWPWRWFDEWQLRFQFFPDVNLWEICFESFDILRNFTEHYFVEVSLHTERTITNRKLVKTKLGTFYCENSSLIRLNSKYLCRRTFIWRKKYKGISKNCFYCKKIRIFPIYYCLNWNWVHFDASQVCCFADSSSQFWKLK